MIQSEEDKKIVDQYKQTNVALRKQLLNLNTQIDRILTKKSNKVGLQKLPSLSKKITDPNVIQHEVQNLRKRAELLERDAELYNNKASVNYYEKIKGVEEEIKAKEEEMEDCKYLIKQYERKDKIANVLAAKDATASQKWEKRIAYLQEQISRYQKIQAELIKEINYQAANDNKAANHLQEVAQRHQEAMAKKKKQERKKSPPPVNPSPITHKKKKSSIGEEEWTELKRQFLMFKQAKQNQETILNEQNEMLRYELKDWQRKIKQKKKRVQSILANEQRNKNRQSKVYSTLEEPKSKNNSRAYRYRDRNNSIQYNTKQ